MHLLKEKKKLSHNNGVLFGLHKDVVVQLLYVSLRATFLNLMTNYTLKPKINTTNSHIIRFVNLNIVLIIYSKILLYM